MAEAAARAWGFTPDSVLAGAQGGAVPAAESGLWADLVECQSGGWPLSASMDKPADSRNAIGSRCRCENTQQGFILPPPLLHVSP